MAKTQDELYDPKVILRFVEKLKEGENGCLEWTGKLNADGYGDISIGGRENQTKVRAHRWALGFAMGGVVLPSEIFACHSCDNPACVCPTHLFPGTNQDNMDDMVSKGRSSLLVTNRKLTDDQVLEIRQSNEFGTVLSKRYGVSEGTVSEIKNNKIWRNLVV